MKEIAYFLSFCVLAWAETCDENTQSGTNDSRSYPCGDSYPVDMKCVRQYFAENGECSVINQSDNAPIIRSRHRSFMPKINLTVTDFNTTLSKLLGPIETFHFDTETNNLVISVRLEDQSFNTSYALFRISRRSRSPLVIPSSLFSTYPTGILTAAIPTEEGRITKELMREAIINAYFLGGSFPTVEIGPNLSESSDPDVIAMLVGIQEEDTAVLEELFITESVSRFLGWFQNQVCDFDIPISL